MSYKTLSLLSALALAAYSQECAFFGPGHDRMAAAGLNRRPSGEFSKLTEQVAGQVNFVPGGSRTDAPVQLSELGTIDRNIYGVLQAKGIEPAPRTNDYEFIRRVTLDLTGRIPAPERVTAFLADTRANKRDLLVDELLAKPEWVDKWTMFYGDLFKNNSANNQIRRDGDGVAAFYTWIADSLRNGKPYTKMATELIAATGADSYKQGELNFLVGSFQSMVPAQDTYDQAAADAARTFLGLSHLNCILCHNGRGHLDTLSLWGKTALRTQAWGMSSYFSRTVMSRVRVNPDVVVPYYWSVETNDRARTDYQLNTTTGNRPARAATGGASANVPPLYLFTSKGPAAGEEYRAAFARELTADPLFAKAAVNYVWEQFFGLAIVTPSDGFDPARLDPDNPPTAAGWGLQPNNGVLLRELAQDFVSNGYDLKKLMRQIVTSEAYQMSSRYPGNWDANWEPLYARHFVRRLWGEEVHDAVVVSSGVLPSYDLARTYPGLSATERYAMRIPEPLATPDRGGAVSRFLDAFLRGNRDDEERRLDGSISQTLGLMNDPLILTRIRGTGNANLLVQKNLGKADDDLIQTLFLTVLSRPPAEAELTASRALLKTGNRTQQAEDLLWSLYNKVDFVFNY